ERPLGLAVFLSGRRRHTSSKRAWRSGVCSSILAVGAPSGHASVAFAAATTYWVLARRERLPHRTRNTIFLYAGAAGVAALRVAAGKHFPTDVLAGAALGSAVGWLVPTIHPTQPLSAGRPRAAAGNLPVPPE